MAVKFRKQAIKFLEKCSPQEVENISTHQLDHFEKASKIKKLVQSGK
jgi:hypothetical protein